MSSTATSTSPDLLDQVAKLARQAGRAILAIYANDFSVAAKADRSPVTEADGAAEELIVAGLRELPFGDAIVAEESVSDAPAPDPAGRFWLVDPLDGTREFVGRNGEFTVNIALIERGRPILGVVLAPVLDRLYAGARGLGAYLEQDGRRHAIACRRPPPEGLTVAGSRSHGDMDALRRFLGARKIARTVSAGSSLKFGMLANGEADVYPRLGRTMEWDTAAGQAVLVAAGGRVNDLRGAELTYGKPGYENPHFVAWGGGTPGRD